MPAKNDFDLVIVGAGIIGAMSAYLARQERPEWRIGLIDRSLVGQGATQYSLGLDFPYGRSATHRRLSLESARAYSQLRTRMPQLPIYDLPLFCVVKKEKMAKVIEGFTGGQAHVAEKDEEAHLRQTYKDLKLSDDQVLLSAGMASYSFPAIVASTLVNNFRHGESARCWEGVEVDTIDVCDGGFKLLISDGRAIKSKRVLVATGPWMLQGPGQEIARLSQVRIKKVAALHVDREPEAIDPVLFFLDEDAFLLPLYRQRRWLFSFTSEEWDCVPEISRLTISAEDRTLAISILSRYCPSFVEHCNGGRVFCDAYSPDRVPLIATAPGKIDYVVAGACAGSGYRLAPGIAGEALRKLSGFPR